MKKIYNPNSAKNFRIKPINKVGVGVKNTFLLLSLIILTSCGKSSYYVRSFPLMGTIINIKVLNSGDARGSVNKVIKKMKNLEEKFNRFDEKSEIYKINKADKEQDICVSDEMYELLDISLDLNKKTNGSFDITVAPFLEIWGFYSEKRSSPPAKEEIEKTLLSVGTGNLKLDKASKSVKFENGSTKIDLNAIATGYIVDDACGLLKQKGVQSALIDAGGDIACFGDNEWLIGIRNPKDKKNIIAKIKLKNKTISTSGGYENFIEIGGETFPHIIDPRTGWPVRSNVLSATVISDRCAVSDALATALFVLRPEEGLSLIEGLKGVDCAIIYEEKGIMKFMISSGIKDKLEIL